MKTNGLHWGVVVLAAVTAAVGWSSTVGRDTPPRELLRMHDKFVLAFIDSEGFGQRRLPPMSGMLWKRVDDSHWRVMGFELIGIAKHNPPRVFSSEMDVFHQRNKATPPPQRSSRAITAWEKQALRELDQGKRLVVEPKGTELRVVGPIRAGVECLGCHKNKRTGDMLGAFVYTLVETPPETPKK